MSSVFSGLSRAMTGVANGVKKTLGLGNTKRRNNRNKNKGAAATPASTPGATPPAPPAETPAGSPTPGASQSAGKMMRAANLRYMKFYKPKKSTRRKSSRKSKGKKATRRR